MVICTCGASAGPYVIEGKKDRLRFEKSPVREESMALVNHTLRTIVHSDRFSATRSRIVCKNLLDAWMNEIILGMQEFPDSHDGALIWDQRSIVNR
jgi:hypothetical protein